LRTELGSKFDCRPSNNSEGDRRNEIDKTIDALISIFEAVARRVSDRAGAGLARSCEESERAIKETTKLNASILRVLK